MKSELSTLLDDELEIERQHVVLAALRGDDELRATWSNYHLIGDALRRTSALDVDLTGRVMTSLQREPTILAPQAHLARSGKRASGVMRYAGAVAASLAGVGVVGWLALSAPQGESQKVAHAMALPVLAVEGHAANATNAGSAASANRMQAYLVAHQAYSPSNRFDGGAGYIRTVAAAR